MKRVTIILTAAIIIMTFASAAWAVSFPITDVRALGMGGAFVAAGEGIGAVNYNPALLAKNTTAGVVVPELIGRFEDHIGMVDLIDDLGNAYDTADTTQMIAILDQLDQGGAVDLNLYAGIGAGFGIFGISGGVTYADLIYGTAYPNNIDAGNLSPSATTNTLELRGVEARQLIITGAKSFGNILVGANLRNINATTYTDSESLFTDPDIDITTGTEAKESAVAWDVGAVLGLSPMLDLGIVARDVGGTDLGVIEFDTRYRVGAAVNLATFTIAADYDITEDDTGSTAYKEWAVGAEFDVWAIALRAGMSQNTGLSGAPTLLHFGLGLGFLDLGAAYADEGNYYMAGVNLSLGF